MNRSKIVYRTLGDVTDKNNYSNNLYPIPIYEEVVPNQTNNTFQPRFRSYHNFIFQWLYSDKWQYLSSFDFGHQSQQENDGVDGWMDCYSSHSEKSA